MGGNALRVPVWCLASSTQLLLSKRIQRILVFHGLRNFRGHPLQTSHIWMQAGAPNIKSHLPKAAWLVNAKSGSELRTPSVLSHGADDHSWTTFKPLRHFTKKVTRLILLVSLWLFAPYRTGDFPAFTLGHFQNGFTCFLLCIRLLELP